MKKFLRVFALALFVAVAGVALAACGGNKDDAKTLTEENLLGNWYVASVAYTPGTGATYTADTCTKAEWDVLEAKADRTAAEEDKFDLFDGYFHTYSIEINQENDPDHVIYDTTGGGHVAAAEWGVADGEITYEAILPGAAADSVVWNNGKVAITVTVPNGNFAGTYVLTLAKVAA